MKKVIMLGLVLAASATLAMAETLNGTIQWAAMSGVYNHSSTSTSFDDYATDGILASYDVLWQLIHTADGTAYEPDPVTWNSDFVQGEHETVIASRLGNASQFDSSWGLDVSLYRDDAAASVLLADVALDNTQAYYVYQRVYELEQGTTAPVKGTYYWQSGVENITPQFDGQVNAAKIWVEYDGQTTSEVPIKPNMVVGVPEPATMSLLGLGALAMVLRRKLRK